MRISFGLNVTICHAGCACRTWRKSKFWWSVLDAMPCHACFGFQPHSSPCYTVLLNRKLHTTSCCACRTLQRSRTWWPEQYISPSCTCCIMLYMLCLQDFAEEQNLVARMMHQLQSDDADEQFHILKTARQHFIQGGPRRVKHTLPPLAFAALKVRLDMTLLLLLSFRQQKCQGVFCIHICLDTRPLKRWSRLHIPSSQNDRRVKVLLLMCVRSDINSNPNALSVPCKPLLLLD